MEVGGGGAFLYSLEPGGAWSQQARILPSLVTNDQPKFGSAAAVSGTNIVVGSPGSTDYTYTGTCDCWWALLIVLRSLAIIMSWLLWHREGLQHTVHPQPHVHTVRITTPNLSSVSSPHSRSHHSHPHYFIPPHAIAYLLTLLTPYVLANRSYHSSLSTAHNPPLQAECD
jgi:hypothetical protein